MEPACDMMALFTAPIRRVVCGPMHALSCIVRVCLNAFKPRSCTREVSIAAAAGLLSYMLIFCTWVGSTNRHLGLSYRSQMRSCSARSVQGSPRSRYSPTQHRACKRRTRATYKRTGVFCKSCSSAIFACPRIFACSPRARAPREVLSCVLFAGAKLWRPGPQGRMRV